MTAPIVYVLSLRHEDDAVVHTVLLASSFVPHASVALSRLI